MAREKTTALVPIIRVEKEFAKLIFVVREQQVVLDMDLAHAYGVETGALNRQVALNPDRFPEDFCFLLTKTEYENLLCENRIASWGGRSYSSRYPPRVFTGEGALAVSGVLRSARAAEASVMIARAFVAMRKELQALSAFPLREMLKAVKRLERAAGDQAQSNTLMVELSALTVQNIKDLDRRLTAGGIE